MSVWNFKRMGNNMLSKEEISRISRRYLVESILTTVALVLLTLGLAHCLSIDAIVAPLSVSAVFSVVVNGLDGFIWKKVASNSEESLPTFYTAVSGFRMLLALATLLVCYIIVGRDAMMVYCLTFIGFYFIHLAHHAIFFARVSNAHGKFDKEK